MKLIIEISEEAYELHKAYRDKYKLSEAIANGTPYNPSVDLISREALKEKAIWTKVNNGAELIDIEVVPLDAIDNAPTVEQFDDTELQRAVGYADGYSKGREERPQGEWKEWTDERWGGTTIYCPYCKEDALEKYSDGLHRQVKSNFCPNCGVKLEKGGAE